jgi:hypothetical protein
MNSEITSYLSLQLQFHIEALIAIDVMNVDEGYGVSCNFKNVMSVCVLLLFTGNLVGK